MRDLGHLLPKRNHTWSLSFGAVLKNEYQLHCSIIFIVLVLFPKTQSMSFIRFIPKNISIISSQCHLLLAFSKMFLNNIYFLRSIQTQVNFIYWFHVKCQSIAQWMTHDNVHFQQSMTWLAKSLQHADSAAQKHDQFH